MFASLYDLTQHSLERVRALVVAARDVGKRGRKVQVGYGLPLAAVYVDGRAIVVGALDQAPGNVARRAWLSYRGREIPGRLRSARSVNPWAFIGTTPYAPHRDYTRSAASHRSMRT